MVERGGADTSPHEVLGAVDEALATALVTAVARLDQVGRAGLDDAVDEALAALGEAVAADRAYAFTYDFGAGLCHNTHEWCAVAIEPQIAILQAFPLHLVPEWVARHRAGEAMDVADVFALPPDSGVRHTLEPQGIKSLASVPMMDGPTCIGFVGLDAVRRHRVFGAQERAALTMVADALVRAYVRLGLVPTLERVESSAAHDAVR
jgi:GAF domain-containing protein